MLSPDQQIEVEEAAIVDEAILSRRSVRAFLPTRVDEQTIRDILTIAARAPSGTNMQPWRTYVVTGETKKKIADAVLNSGIRAEKAKTKDLTCLIAADGGVDHARVVWLIDLVKQEGVAKFAINIDLKTVEAARGGAATPGAEPAAAPAPAGG